MKDGKVIDDWVDADEIRQLAEKLISTPKAKAPSSDDPAYGEDFEGFVDPPAVRAEPIVAPVPVTPEPTPPEPATGKKEPKPEESPPSLGPVQLNPFDKKSSGGEASKATVASPFRAAPPRKFEESKAAPTPQPSGKEASSLESFVDWVKKEIPLEALLICGKGGRVLFDDLRQTKLASVARLLAGAAHRKGKSPMKAMVIKTGPKRVLQVIPSRQDRDDYFAALLLPRPLADSGVSAFERALQKALGGR
jgi:hypothetical protein